MKATTKNNDLMLCEKYALDTRDLMQVLSCGRSTAVEIGMAAGAKIQIGKRVLWNTNKIKQHLDRISLDKTGGVDNED
jgi:hypothetical protein